MLINFAFGIFLSLFAGFIFFISVSTSVQGRRSIEALSGCQCPACGAIYELQVARNARENFLARCGEARRAQPHMKLNFGHRWPVVCSYCGKRSSFDFYANKLG